MRDVLKAGVLLGLALVLIPACHDDDDDDNGVAPPPPGDGGGTGAGSIQFSTPAYSVSEGAGSVILLVARVGGTVGPASVFFDTDRNGESTALPGQDFTAGSAQLTWADGEGGERQISIPIASDVQPEGDEFFFVFLGSNQGASLGSPSTALVTILDDDVGPGGAFQFTRRVYSQDERFTPLLVGVTRTGGSTGAAAVDVVVRGGSAGPQDFSLPFSSRLTWNDGETGEKQLSIDIANDNLEEGRETVNLALANNTPGSFIGTVGEATIEILDDDFAGRIGFNPDQYDVFENGVSVTVTVRREDGSMGSVSVDFAAIGGSATPDADYSLPAGSLTWADGDTSDKSFVITIVWDDVSEATETILLGLSSPTPGVIIGRGTAEVRIVDVARTKAP